MCIGMSGKTAILYFDKLREKTDYKIMEDREGEKARGYGVTYVPPNTKSFSEDENTRFEEWILSVKMKILNDDIKKYFVFNTEEEQDDYKELMVDMAFKEDFVDENIINKLRTHIWWRYYNVKGELIDDAFMEPIERTIEEDQTISCPNAHIR